MVDLEAVRTVGVAACSYGSYSSSVDVGERLEQNGIRVDLSLVADIARRFGVAELSVFGSAIREDIRADSDVDVLVTFDPAADISLFDLMDLEVELTRVFGRSVDLVEAKSLTNPIRREAILASREPLKRYSRRYLSLR